jgi:hypothetical protein
MPAFLRYSFGTAVSPAKSLDLLARDERRVRHAAEAVLFVGLLYAAVSIALAAAGAVPLAPAFIDIEADNYYAWQALFSLPFVLLNWVLAAGLLQVLGRGKKRAGPFEASLAASGAAAAASLAIAWVPLAVITVFMALGMRQEEMVGILSPPGFWQTVDIAWYVAAGLSAPVFMTLAAAKSRKLATLRAAAAGLLAGAVLVGAFVVFMR